MTPETQTALREKLSDERINGLLRDGPKARCWFSDIEMVAALRELQQHRALVSPEPAAGEVYDPEFGRHLASMLVPHPTDEPQADDLREPAAGQAQEPRDRWRVTVIDTSIKPPTTFSATMAGEHAQARADAFAERFVLPCLRVSVVALHEPPAPQEPNEPVVTCANCGTVNEASVANREDVIAHLHKGSIPVVVPVWTCHVCGQSWTGDRGELIREAAVTAAPQPVPAQDGPEPSVEPLCANCGWPLRHHGKPLSSSAVDGGWNVCEQFRVQPSAAEPMPRGPTPGYREPTVTYQGRTEPRAQYRHATVDDPHEEPR